MNHKLTSSITSRRADVIRMAFCGIAENKIAFLLGIRLETLKLFFPYELEKGAVIASIRLPKNTSHPPKRDYTTHPAPRSLLVIRGPNGEEVI